MFVNKGGEMVLSPRRLGTVAIYFINPTTPSGVFLAGVSSKPYTRPDTNGRKSRSYGLARDSLTMRKRGINAASLRRVRQNRSLGSLGRLNPRPGLYGVLQQLAMLFKPLF